MRDPYILDNGVLRNKLGITDIDELRKAEADIGFLKLINIDSLSGSLNEKLLRDIHRHIFEDIFDWAGNFRTVPLVKEELVLPGYSIPYCDSKNIKKELTNRINKMNMINWNEMDIKQLSMTFAREIALLWKVHPFRDGNTRTTLSFAYIFAKKKGFPFSIEPFLESLDRKYDEHNHIKQYSIRDKFVLASLDDEYNPEVKHLAAVFKKAITQDKEIKSKKTYKSK
jgi:cell filamentation protein